MNVNVSLVEESVIQINGGIMINSEVSAENDMYGIVFGILPHVTVKTEYI